MTPPVSNRPRPPRVRPYPLDELPRLLRAQVELSRVLWRHLYGLLESAAGARPSGWAAVEEELGGRLALFPQEPYLCSAERLSSLLRGARLLALSLHAPGQTSAVLAVDEKLGQRVGLLGDAQLAEIVAAALQGAPLSIAPTQAAEVATILGRDEAPRSLLVLELEVAARGERGFARLLCPAQLRLSVPPPASPSALERAFERRSRIGDVRVPLCIEAGYGFLPGREVLALQPGDVVLLDHFGPKPVTGGPVWLRLGGGVFPGHLDGDGVTVLGSFYLRAQAMPQSMNDPAPGQGEGDGAAAVEGAAPPVNESLLRELPVQITCEIGRVTLSAREVLELRPGAVVPVGRPLAGPVDLTAGGRIIARGELVDVEGEIGVRVTEVQD